MKFARVLILGCGYVGLRVLRLARQSGLPVAATIRGSERVAALEAEGATVLQAAELGAEIEPYLAGARVVVAYPADPNTDARIAPRLSAAHSVVYISSTGVYGDHRGRLDDHTPLPELADARSQRLRDAEAHYRRIGATILRSPGIYGPDRGLHVRVLRGQHSIPGSGANTLSRIHAEDLAQLTLSAAAPRGETYVVGDLEPAPHIEVVRYVCEAYGVPLPPAVPIESLHASLRADRTIDPRRALTELGVQLRYPSYRQGMAPENTRLQAPA